MGVPQIPAITVRVLGGRQPIVGASVQLKEVGIFGPGTSNTLASTSTDSAGYFSFTQAQINACAYPGSQLYITSSGGDAGNGYNFNIFLMGMVGPCDNLSPFAIVNELTSVAASYAFNSGMTTSSPDKIGVNGPPGSPAYDAVDNSFMLYTQNLIDIATGTASPFLSTGLNSPAMLNTLADIAVACVNSLGFQFQACPNLYAEATPPGGSAPSTLLQALFAIASNPANNPDGIYSILGQVPSDVPYPYTPVLPQAPEDWTLVLNYPLPLPGNTLGVNGAPLNSFERIAIDADGNIWIANATGGQTGHGSIFKLDSTGTDQSPPGGYLAGGNLNAPYGLSFAKVTEPDATGDLWVTNFVGGTVLAIDSGGSLVVPSQGTVANGPTSIATDGFAQVWVANSQATDPSKQLTVTSTSGAVIHYVSGFGLNQPTDIAVDTTSTPNIIWVANTGPGGATRLIDSGLTNPTGTLVPGGNQLDQREIALDKNGDAWVSNSNPTAGSLTKLSGTAVALGPVTGGGITSTSVPWGIAVDGNANVWVNNFNDNSVTELDTNGNVLSPPGGFKAGGTINGPAGGIAIDSSGDVWVLNTGNNTLTEFVGAAAPVTTPISSGRAIHP
jgi:hypothetical protein